MLDAINQVEISLERIDKQLSQLEIILNRMSRDILRG